MRLGDAGPHAEQPDTAFGGAGSGPAIGSALARCTHLGRQGFAAEVWGKRPSLSRADQLSFSAGFADLFSIEQADHVLSRQGLRTPFLRAAKDGVALSPNSVSSSGGSGALIADQVDDTKVAALFDGGTTIVLQGLHRTHPPLEEFGRTLGAELGHPVQVNAYVTPPQSKGFAAHYDTHDVFVLQICGRKRWIIHAPVLASPLPQHPWPERREEVQDAAARAPYLEAVLDPGDALYLPRGWLHAADALDEASIHLTVGVHVWTRLHLVERVLSSAGEAESLRTSLPLGVDFADPTSFADDFRAAVSELRRIAEDARIEEAAALLSRDARTSTRPEPIAPIAQALLARHPDPGLKIRWRDGIAPDTPMPDRAEYDDEALDQLRAGHVLTAAEFGVAAASAALAAGLVVPAP